MDQLDVLLWLALQEDLGHADVTSVATIPADLTGRARVHGREPFVLSGSHAFQRVFQILDDTTRVRCCFEDGQAVAAHAPVFELEGKVRTLLAGERTALNLLQRLCGVATLTRKMVEALSATPCRLLDTRKTTPLWRALEKQAVRHGGGYNHRFNLADGVLIKDNHIAAAGSIKEAVQRAKTQAPHTLRIEVEVDTLEQLDEALHAAVDVILLDNFSVEMLRRAVTRTRGRALLEASGGVTLESVHAIAQTGVDFISCGALTHSARAIDIGLELLG
jgi:nicotinate-nucleotide pyrophosphorylase (carboxylating)